MFYPFFVCILLKNYFWWIFKHLLFIGPKSREVTSQNSTYSKNFWSILIFFARDDAKLMPGEVCQVSCRCSNKWRSYSGKTERGSDPTPRRWRVYLYIFWKPLLHNIPVPDLVKFRQRVSGLEGIRLKNKIVPCGHKFDPSGSSRAWHVCHTRAHLPWKFGISASSPALHTQTSHPRSFG